MPSSTACALVLGCRGMLGRDLMEALEARKPYGQVIAGDLPAVDITDPRSIESFLAGRKPDVLFNCAAMTDVDGCETQRERAFAVNAEGAGHVAACAAALGARCIHVSTDYVFDGRKRAPYVEEDAPAPLSVYGQSKLAGERLVAERGREWCIARTGWLYGGGRRNFVDDMLRRAQESDELSVVTDRVGSPTWSRDLATALIALAQSPARGLLHAANAGACSRFDQVQFMLKVAGLNTRLKRARSRAFPRPARTPAYCALDSGKLAREAGCVMRPWQEALEMYLRAESPACGRG